MAKSIKIASETWRRIEECAKKAGYSSPEELVENAIARELARVEEEETRTEVERRLKGLGYLE
jgi:predicted transcriptional regulator